MLRTADRPPRSAQKAGLLRVLKALAAVARYCGRNAGGLFLLVWFPCLMVAASQIVLDWLSLSFPPKLPSWLLSQSFNPPTWLTAASALSTRSSPAFWALRGGRSAVLSMIPARSAL